MTLNRNIELVTVARDNDMTWISFKDFLDVKCDLRGITYRNPTLSSFKRLLRVLSDDRQVKLELIPDGSSFIVFGWHKFDFTRGVS